MPITHEEKALLNSLYYDREPRNQHSYKCRHNNAVFVGENAIGNRVYHCEECGRSFCRWD